MPAQVEAGLAGLAGRLCPLVAVAGTTGDAAGWAIGVAAGRMTGWLLILDNVEDPADVEPLLGQLGGGHVIVTSRRDADWGRLADPVQLDVLDPAAAAQMLILRTGQARRRRCRRPPAQIAAELGFLPLALDQAAAYIVQQRITPGRLPGQPAPHPPGCTPPAAATRSGRSPGCGTCTSPPSATASPAAARLLGVLAQYAPDAIPRAMLGGDAPREDTDEALGLLASYSMITLTTETVSIHRLFRPSSSPARDDTGDDGAAACGTRPWTGLTQRSPTLPDTDMAGWPLLRALVPHAEALASHFPPGDQPETLGRVQNQIATFLDSQGDYARALPLRQSALAIYRGGPGTRPPRHGHPRWATSPSPTGTWAATPTRCPSSSGRWPITEAALGPDHPDTAIRLNNLGRTYRDLGRAAEALPLQQRALAHHRDGPGTRPPRHGHPAGQPRPSRYRTLAAPPTRCPCSSGRWRITEAALGPDHPDTATRPEQPRRHATATWDGTPRRCPCSSGRWRITEAALGPDHPDTAAPLDNLAATYRDLGRAAEALPLQQRALAHHRDRPGPRPPQHGHPAGQPRRHLPRPGTGRRGAAPAAAGAGHHRDRPRTRPPRHGHPAHNLAATYRDLGRAAEALPLEERAARIRQRSR